MSANLHIYSIPAFTAALVRSGLVTEETCNTLVMEYRTQFLSGTDLPDSITAFCSYLVSANILTNWQVAKLRAGQWKGFFVDAFVIMDILGHEGQFTHFLARDTNSERRYVRLAVDIGASREHSIKYHVVHVVDDFR